MPKKMLIDATHAEETRVVVVDGNKVEEFDFESENKRQLAGNIYLAKITRVEPSLQAAFVDYGGNRHGFLAFSEIHPDYYQIPVADREKLLKEEAEYAKAMAEEEARREEREKAKPRRRSRRSAAKTEAASDGAPAGADKVVTSDVIELDGDADTGLVDVPEATLVDVPESPQPTQTEAAPTPEAPEAEVVAETPAEAPAETGDAQTAAPTQEDAPAADTSEATPADDDAEKTTQEEAPQDIAIDSDDAEAEIEDDADDPVLAEVRTEVRPRKPRPRRYKIQEVVKVRQIMLVQVVKEERGNKGAALTTYLSLAGRYCVLMPNTARGGGISRKITSATDRKKLKEIASEIEVPEGAGLIIRTAGAKRTKTDIKRDYEYLLRQWSQIRELTLKSIAPAGIYEEGDLIKRTIRDLFNRDIDEVLVEGEGGYKIAKDYMQMLMPNHVERVKLYQESMPLFARFQVENYLDGMFNPVVQLKSGGYIVIGINEALVAIDVNSGKSTKEGSIEDTAVRTNLEAADEVARQLKLRDLAGLIVIDFIDMDERRNNTAVEKRMKDRLKNDRARIQVGRISSFGLMEMSRQRLRPGMLEATTQPCPSCHGTGLVRSDDSLALAVLRELEEEATRKRSREVLITAPVSIANYLLNEKREHIAMIEGRSGMAVRIISDPHLITPEYKLERFKTSTRRIAKLPQSSPVTIDSVERSAPEEEETVTTQTQPVNGENPDEQQPKKRRRRRRRRGGKDRGDKANGAAQEANASENATPDAPAEPARTTADETAEQPAALAEEKPRKSRTATRGRRKKVAEDVSETAPQEQAETVEEAQTTSTETAPEVEAAPVAETAPEAAPEAEVEAVKEPKPKRAPRKSRAKKADTTDAETEEKPKPRKRVRKKKADETEADAETGAKTEEVKKPVKRRRTKKAVAEEVKAEPEAAPAPKVEEPVAEPAPEAETPVAAPVADPEPQEAAPAAPDEPAKPKRSGWWSRALGK